VPAGCISRTARRAGEGADPPAARRRTLVAQDCVDPIGAAFAAAALGFVPARSSCCMTPMSFDRAL